MVENVEDDPTAVDDTFAVAVDSISTVLDVLANDLNPDKSKNYTYRPSRSIDSNWLISDAVLITSAHLRVEAIGDPDQQGSIELGEWGQLIYTPAEGFEGFETFSYTIVTNHGRTDTGTVTVKVGSPEEPETPAPIIDTTTDTETGKEKPPGGNSYRSSELGPQVNGPLALPAKVGTQLSQAESNKTELPRTDSPQIDWAELGPITGWSSVSTFGKLRQLESQEQSRQLASESILPSSETAGQPHQETQQVDLAFSSVGSVAKHKLSFTLDEVLLEELVADQLGR